MYAVPRDSTNCSRCLRQGADERGVPRAPCADHRDARGEAHPYDGDDVYAPTAWVQSVVGARYTTATTGVDGRDTIHVYVCQGYDPREGFWMRHAFGPPVPTARTLVNVSERAINRTYHALRVSSGAWTLLQDVLRQRRLSMPCEAHAMGILVVPKVDQSVETAQSWRVSLFASPGSSATSTR